MGSWKWYTAIVSSKRHKTLYIAIIVWRILGDADSPADALEMHFVMREYGLVDVKEETLAKHLPDDPGIFH